ncbi:MAG: NAD(P)/FAD-dependent oxidoreductase, partial [Planctomycetes bacterium]|nr:NAD(P)/FAD-dependent oxidoreductase [Planctomycetota bacterium]
FDVSRIAAELLNYQEAVEVTVDFLPALNREELVLKLIERCAANPKKEISGVLSEWFPKRLASFLQHTSCGSQTVFASGFLKQQRQKLIDAIKAMPLTLIRSGSLEKATVTRGGVSREEIDPQTMQSRLCKGLFFAGEVIDVDGPCGGYNLQIAFSTGVLAGRSAAHFCR